MGLRAREQIIKRNMSCMRANLALLEAFFAKHIDKFRWYPPHGGTVCFPELITGESSGIFPLPACDRPTLQVYSHSLRVIGPHCRYIPPPFL
jgi:hypothetical protein